MSRYALMHNNTYINYEGNDQVEIGKVIDMETGEDVFYIDYDKHCYRNNGYHICPVIYENESGKCLVIIMDDMHRYCMINQSNVFMAIVLHEYGHFINGDLSRKGLTNAMIQNDRLRCILEGRVQEEELKADAFAISHVGKNTFMRSMDYFIKKRKERGDKDMLMAIREFELRKKAAQKIRL